MTVREMLHESTQRLQKAQVELPHLDALLLASQVMQCSKEQVYVSYPDEIDPALYIEVMQLIEQRCTGIPVSYLRRKKDFYNNEFYVDSRVLVPRPDTEIIVDAVKEFILQRGGTGQVLDLCTGSGCIAITLAELLPAVHITGADISSDAGEVFLRNAEAILGKPLPFVCTDLFSNIQGKYDCIVANPPYVTTFEVEEMINRGWPEPVLALDGGPDGTDFLCRIIKQAPQYLNHNGALFCEAAGPQMGKLKDIMEKEKYIDIELFSDLGGRERVIRGIWQDK
ncbi:MAG: peptide chain release factor N(5)-glutamine methyltransferase [Spirochaetales bacterium]|nr:peptide chain release factor N(5)-glutamine methyltransferase [Spirochaetales bacterium]